MARDLEIKWHVNDGYVSGSRPHTSKFSAEDFDPDASDEELEGQIYDAVQDDFAQSITFGIDDAQIKAAIAAIRKQRRD